MSAMQSAARPPVVVFDLFGTLLDIASLRTAASAMCEDASAFVTTWRDKQIAYAFASAIMDRYEDFDAITAHALDFAMARYGLTLEAVARLELLSAWERVSPYPDAVATLRTLRAGGVRCAVLTNGTRRTAHAAMAAAGIAGSLERTFFVEDAGVYKPDSRVYALVTDAYRIQPDEVIFVTSNGWDATGAAAFGYRVAWCNRFANPHETYGPPPTWTIASLEELPALIGAS